MILVTTDYISGNELETLGLVTGSTVRSKDLAVDVMQGLKSLIGGELKAYTEMMDEARALATKRMMATAKKMGADGIVSIRYATTAIAQNASEIIVYGTAVKFKG